MKSSILLATVITSAIAYAALPESPSPQSKSWQRLLDGNARFVSDMPKHPRQDGKRRTEVAAGQKPFAVIIGCADSRTPPELLFDEGLGELFVVRLAGNIVDDAALGSVEFAVAKLGARLIVVLGHEKCGAVAAAVDAVKGAAAPPGSIGAIVDAIKPAAANVHGQPGDEVDNAVRANVLSIVERLKKASPILSPLVQNGELTLVGARYDLDDGKVQQLP